MMCSSCAPSTDRHALVLPLASHSVDHGVVFIQASLLTTLLSRDEAYLGLGLGEGRVGFFCVASGAFVVVRGHAPKIRRIYLCLG